MSSLHGPRVLIATLFLPETVNFHTPPPSPSLSPLQPATHDQHHHPSSILSSTNPSKTNDENSVPFPSSHSHSTSRPSERGGPLTPIASGHSTPTGRGESGIPTSGPPGSLLSSLELSSTSVSKSPAPLSRNPSSSGLPTLKTDQERGASGLSSPGVGQLLAINPAVAAHQKPALSRSLSIVDDLKTRGTGPGSFGASTKGRPDLGINTPADLELGQNPFDGATTPGLVGVGGGGATTPSLQSSIASKRPNPNRLTSEGSALTGFTGLASLGNAVRERLERNKTSSLVPRAAGQSPLQSPSIIKSSGSGGGREKGGASSPNYFGDVPHASESRDPTPTAASTATATATATATSPDSSTASAPPSSATSQQQQQQRRNRRRSSSASRNSFTGGGPPGLNRTFSRSRTHSTRSGGVGGSIDRGRRRSSAALDSGTVYTAGSLEDGDEGDSTLHVPQFYFQSNPHGNGGLQNAVKSVEDNRVRTASDPGTRVTSPGVPSELGHARKSPPGSGATPGHNHTSSSSLSASTTSNTPRRTPVPSNSIPSTTSATARGGAFLPGQPRSPLGDYTWVGTIGCGISDFDQPLRRACELRYLEEKRSAVVWVEDDVLEPAYDSFCKQILWPTFHYQIHDAHKSKAYESPAWKDYVAMNQAFADKIVSVYRDGDLIWVNDYHLLLVPQMVRSKIPGATIGFFLHIAFPSSEIFRCLANRREILEGVLGADLIGFQTYNTARHFRQTCQRLLAVEATPKGIQLESGFAKVGVFPIGIDVKALHERKKVNEVSEWVTNLREHYKGLKIIMGRDKLDEIKGVRQKLVAFESFLERYPEWQGKVVLIQVAMATSEENEKQGEVMDVVGRINARFSNFTYQPVVFLHQEVSFSQYLALLIVADAFINTSLREGMNLTSHEFIICQEGHWGPLILSEFTGSYSRAGFQRCLPVNPYDKIQCANVIKQALEMPEDEKISRWRDLERHVWTQTAQHWCSGFLHALQRETVATKSRPLASPAIGMSNSPPVFDARDALPAYKASKKRLLLLDLEGTLSHDDPHTARRRRHHNSTEPAVTLGPEVEEALKALARDPKNTVYIMSGRNRSDLAEVAHRFPELGFIAENGCFVTLPVTSSSSGRKWHKLITGTHTSWRQPVLEILRYYTERTPGSYIDDRGLSIVWRYANTGDQGSGGILANGMSAQYDEPPKFENGRGNEAYIWARRQAAEVQNHIMDSLGERFGLQLYPGATSFLILPRKAGRAVAVAHILQSDDFSDLSTETELTEQAEAEAENAGRSVDLDRGEEADSNETKLPEVNKAAASCKLMERFDHVLSMGEDQRLCAWLEEMSLEKIITVTVGEKKRGARWHLPGVDDVAEALHILSSA